MSGRRKDSGNCTGIGMMDPMKSFSIEPMIQRKTNSTYNETKNISSLHGTVVINGALDSHQLHRAEFEVLCLSHHFM